jgi:hypothetical protein
MKNLLAFCCAIACLSALISCECRKVDCAIDEQIFFKFISKTDSTDLIMNGSYSLSSVVVTAMLVNQSKAGGTITIAPSGDDYTVSVTANTNVDSYIIQLGSLQPDTLKITTKLGEGDKCCSGILEFETLQLNGDILANDYANATLQLYK